MLPTLLGGTRVIINDVDAPLFFVSNYQVNAQVPWEVVGGLLDGNSASIVVEFLGTKGNAVEVATERNSPGVYTADGTGTGQATVFNSDGTLNGPDNPAQRGTAIFAYYIVVSVMVLLGVGMLALFYRRGWFR